MRRTSGHYWIKVGTEWTTGRYLEQSQYPWEIMGSERFFTENELEKVGEKIERKDDVECLHHPLIQGIKDFLSWENEKDHSEKEWLNALEKLAMLIWEQKT